MKWRRWWCRCDDSTDDARTSSAAAPTKVKTSHPGMQLLLSQGSLGRMERPQELGISRGGAPTAAPAAADLTGFPGAVGRGLTLMGDGRRAHLGKQGRVGESITPGTLKRSQSQPGQKASRGVTGGLMLLLELLLMLQLDLLLVAQLSF